MTDSPMAAAAGTRLPLRAGGSYRSAAQPAARQGRPGAGGGCVKNAAAGEPRARQAAAGAGGRPADEVARGPAALSEQSDSPLVQLRLRGGCVA